MQKKLVRHTNNTTSQTTSKNGVVCVAVVALGTVLALYLSSALKRRAAGIRSYIDKREELQREVANENTQLAWRFRMEIWKKERKTGLHQDTGDNVAYMVLPSYPGRGIDLTSPAPATVLMEVISSETLHISNHYGILFRNSFF
jgi:hypothetical protein